MTCSCIDLELSPISDRHHWQKRAAFSLVCTGNAVRRAALGEAPGRTGCRKGYLGQNRRRVGPSPAAQGDASVARAAPAPVDALESGGDWPPSAGAVTILGQPRPPPTPLPCRPRPHSPAGHDSASAQPLPSGFCRFLDGRMRACSERPAAAVARLSDPCQGDVQNRQPRGQPEVDGQADGRHGAAAAAARPVFAPAGGF